MPSRIGTFDFQALEGHPIPPTGQPLVIARPGVGGVGIWRTGVRGRPFQMRSRVDMPDLAMAEEMAGQYTTLVEQDPVVLEQDDIEFDYKVVVLGVARIACHVLVMSVGGINPPGRAWLEAEWQLIAIGDEGVAD